VGGREQLGSGSEIDDGLQIIIRHILSQDAAGTENLAEAAEPRERAYTQQRTSLE
jgi:hypothetical protein